MPDESWPADAPATFRVTVLKERKSERRAIELHAPGFFTCVMKPDRAAALAEDLRGAAASAMAGAEKP